MLFNHNRNCKYGWIDLSCIKMRNYFPKINIELVVWVTGLIYLAIIHPGADSASFCLAKMAGFSGCPGCGLGASITHLFHGEWLESWNSHKLGALVLVALVLRIIQIIKLQYLPLKPIK